MSNFWLSWAMLLQIIMFQFCVWIDFLSVGSYLEAELLDYKVNVFKHLRNCWSLFQGTEPFILREAISEGSVHHILGNTCFCLFHCSYSSKCDMRSHFLVLNIFSIILNFSSAFLWFPVISAPLEVLQYILLPCTYHLAVGFLFLLYQLFLV